MEGKSSPGGKRILERLTLILNLLKWVWRKDFFADASETPATFGFM
jgi:hypothetical protein